MKRLGSALLAFLLAVPAVPGRANAVACFTAFTANDKARSYRMILTSRNGVETIDMVKPDRMHILTNGTEIIAIGNRGWARLGPNSVWKPTPAMSMSDIRSMLAAITGKQHSGDTCVDAGMGSYRGHPAHLYKGTHAGPFGPSKGTIYVFGDRLVHHIDAVSARGTLSMDFTDFNTATVYPPE